MLFYNVLNKKISIKTRKLIINKQMNKQATNFESHVPSDSILSVFCIPDRGQSASQQANSDKQCSGCMK